MGVHSKFQRRSSLFRIKERNVNGSVTLTKWRKIEGERCIIFNEEDNLTDITDLRIECKRPSESIDEEEF